MAPTKVHTPHPLPSKRALTKRVVKPVARLIVWLSALIATLTLGIGLVVMVLVRDGSLSIAFLKPYLEQSFVRLALPFEVTFDESRLSWSSTHRRFGIDAAGVKISEKGRQVATLEHLTLSFSMTALLRGVIAPTRMELAGPELEISRSGPDTFHLRLAQVEETKSGAESTSPSGAWQDFLSSLLGPNDPRQPAANLEEVKVSNGKLIIKDTYRNQLWLFAGLNLTLLRNSDGIAADFSVGDPNYGPANISGQIIKLAEQTAQVQVRWDKFTPADLAPFHPALAELRGLSLPLTGSVAFASDLQTLPDDISFEIRSGNGTAEFPTLWPEAVKVQSLELVGHFLKDEDRVQIDRGMVQTAGPVFHVKGSINSLKNLPALPPELDLEIDLAALKAEEVQYYWPKPLAPGARAWVTEHILSGNLPKAYCKLALSPSEINGDTEGFDPGSLLLTFEFDQVTAQYLPTLPPVTDGKGHGELTESAFKLTLNSGNSARIELVQSSVLIDQVIANPDPPVTIQINTKGKLSDSLLLIDSKPLLLATDMGIDPKQVGGRAQVFAEIKFPILKDLALKDVQVAAKAQLTDASWPQIQPGIDLTEAILNLTADRTQVEITGIGKLNQQDSKLHWFSQFAKKADPYEKIEVTTQLREEDRATLGIPELPFVKGPVTATAKIDRYRDRSLVIAVDADLATTEVGVPELGYKKTIGEKLNLKTEIRRSPKGEFQFPVFELEGEKMAASAEFSVSLEQIQHLKISKLKTGRTDISAIAKRIGPDRMNLAISGQSLDLAPYLQIPPVPNHVPEPTGWPALSFAINLNQLWVGDKRQFQKVTLGGLYAKDKVARLEGVVHGGQRLSPLRLSVSPSATGKERVLTASADDAGGVVEALFGETRVKNGHLRLSATMNDQEPLSPAIGQLEIRNFTLEKAPVLAQIFHIGLMVGFVDLLQGQGIHFNRLLYPFTYRDGRIETTQARAHGASLGITLKGTIDLPYDEVALKGNVAPAYVINSLLSNIPLLGSALSGGKGEGLFAASFTITGSTDDPKTLVNPLSAITPGPLREVFRVFGEPEANKRALAEGGAGPLTSTSPTDSPTNENPSNKESGADPAGTGPQIIPQ